MLMSYDALPVQRPDAVWHYIGERFKINTEDSDHAVRDSTNIACSLLNAQSLKKKDETLQ